MQIIQNFSTVNASGEGLYYLGSLVYKKRNNTLTLESAGFSGGRFVASEIPSGTTYRPNYFITDHLGSVRAVINSDGDIVKHNDYYPFGKRWDSGLLSDNRYHYNGKEDQAFAGFPYIDYGARMYDPEFRVTWNGADPLAEKYYPISPYVFCAGNPIKYFDPDGQQIDISLISVVELLSLLSDLRYITGLDLSYNNGKIVYGYNDNGNVAQINEDFSPTARGMVRAAIDNEEMVYTYSSFNTGTQAINEDQGWRTYMGIEINSNQIRNFIEGTSDDLDPRTMGYGMTFYMNSNRNLESVYHGYYGNIPFLPFSLQSLTKS